MMMGLGFWTMLAILAVPILLVISLIILVLRPVLDLVNPAGAAGRRRVSGSPAIESCDHCGSRLRPEWAYCPLCGRPAGHSAYAGTG
jgi:hypothetical protein